MGSCCLVLIRLSLYEGGDETGFHRVIGGENGCSKIETNHCVRRKVIFQTKRRDPSMSSD